MSKLLKRYLDFCFAYGEAPYIPINIGGLPSFCFSGSVMVHFEPFEMVEIRKELSEMLGLN